MNTKFFYRSSLAATLIALPWALACGTLPESINKGSGFSDGNSRSAYTTFNSQTDSYKSGGAGSTVTPDTGGPASAASFQTASNDLRDQNDLAADPTQDNKNYLFDSTGNSGTHVDNGNATSQRSAAFNVNGEDVFLSLQSNDVATGFEDAITYTGVRTASNDIDRSAGRTATYNGTGRVAAYTSDGPMAFDTNVELTADFDPGANTIAGTMTATNANPLAIQSVILSGIIHPTDPDYEITDISLFDTASNEVVVMDSVGGVGSFFGAGGNGTAGVISGHGTYGINSDFNMKGWFVASTPSGSNSAPTTVNVKSPCEVDVNNCF